MRSVVSKSHGTNRSVGGTDDASAHRGAQSRSSPTLTTKASVSVLSTLVDAGTLIGVISSAQREARPGGGVEGDEDEEADEPPLQ